jgi:hypothetical protein
VNSFLTASQVEFGWLNDAVTSRLRRFWQRRTRLRSSLRQRPTNWLAAGRIDDPTSIIDLKLYWTAVSNIDEARYLVAVLNSQTVLDRVQPFQALGLFKGRDFDKNIFMVAIPTFDSASLDHTAIVDLTGLAEDAAAVVDISRARTFQQARALIRRELVNAGLADRIEEAEARVLPKFVMD